MRYIFLIALLILGSIIIGTEIHDFNTHEITLFKLFPETFFYVWIPLLICLLIGLAGLWRHRKDKLTIDLVIFVLSVFYLVFVAATGIFKKGESSNAQLLVAADGGPVGILSIHFKTDHVYTLTNGNGLGYTWFEGKYVITKDTIALDGPTDIIQGTMVIKWDSAHCPQSLAYRLKREPGFPEHLLPVTFDSLYCK